MQDSIFRFSLDIHSTQSQVSIPVPQFDTARSIMATLTEGGKPYQLTEDCRAVFTGTKADGNPLFNDCIILNGSVIRYDFTEQTAAVVGLVDCRIKVYGANGKLLTSPRLALLVYDGDDIDYTPSAPEVNALNNIMQVETNRVIAESERIAAEASRVIAEEERQAAEKARQEAEDGRASGLSGRIEVLEGQVADLLYEPMAIEIFSNSVNTAEMGATVRSVSLSWVFNKAAVTATLDGEAIDPSASGGMGQSGLSITANKAWTLKAVDERGAEAVKTTGISFLNGVYYGAAAAPSAIDSSFILSLTKTLRSSKLSSFTVTAGAGQYIYYCVPKRFGTCSFTVGGFDGGFDLAATVSFTNGSGYTEDYYVYRSTHAGLGNTTVGVK